MSALTDKTILIIGLGMIGGSVAKALSRGALCKQILAYDKDENQIQAALDDGGITGRGELASLCRQADLILIALPTLTLTEILPDIAPVIGRKTVLTDVASVKSNVVAAVNALGPQLARRFVPGHPIAGSELSGYRAARPDLFEGRKVILTPQSNTDIDAVNLVNSLWRELGANVLGMSIAKHDQVLAATSHLPHLLAFAIVDVLINQEQSEDIFRYAAGGFADFSRLASSDARMWADIFIANSKPTTIVLDQYIENLTQLRSAIEQQQHAQLMQSFGRAKKARDQFIKKYSAPAGEVNVTESQALNYLVEPGGHIAGDIRVPGDKSISHRAIIFGSLAEGVSHIKGFLEGEDALNTLKAFREMGVTIVGPESGELTIYGVGMHGLKAPRKPLYMGNSGTAMRLMSGLLAAQEFNSELVGDESLSTRPMGRVAEPLRLMGAHIDTAEGGTPPLRIQGKRLTALTYNMPMASAQVKSCLLLAGLYAQGETAITQPAPCRDHTERMLMGFQYPITQDLSAATVSLSGGHKLLSKDIDIPADISSAAFFLVAASISPGAQLTLRHVGVNPTRTGIIDLLKLMGADIKLINKRNIGGEPVADIEVRYAHLHGIEIPVEQIPLAIDEFPVLFVAAACAKGKTLLRGAGELRVKESDRLDAMATGLNELGVSVEVFADGIGIEGGSIKGGEVDSQGDHRIAMAFVMAALRAESPIKIKNCANVATSFPGFVDLSVSLGISVRETTG